MGSIIRFPVSRAGTRYAGTRTSLTDRVPFIFCASQPRMEQLWTACRMVTGDSMSIRIGLVGLGKIATTQHVPAIAATPGRGP